MEKITFMEFGGVLKVTVPFKLKDEFKAEFRAARWNPEGKEWILPRGYKDQVAEFSLALQLKRLEEIDAKENS